MKTPQQTADDLKKVISARSTALNQFNADIEVKQEVLKGIEAQITESKLAQEAAEKGELKAQAVLAATNKKIAEAEANLLKLDNVKENKLKAIIEVEAQHKEAMFHLVSVQEEADTKYEALNNRYDIIKRAIRKEMDKVRDILK